MDSYFIENEFGTITLNWSGQGLLKSIRWSAAPAEPRSARSALHPFWRNWIDRLQEYLGNGAPYGEIPWDKIDSEGWSPFQKQVYHSISMIPHGETRTYSWVATKVGKPAAGRAVGQALRRNPVMILIPCHRVVSSEGGFGGFMGKQNPDEPELCLKRRLIGIETSYLNPMFPFLAEPSLERTSDATLADLA